MKLSDCGACFMAGLPGIILDTATKNLISHYGVNHFILFTRNIENESQVRGLCQDIMAYCLDHGLEESLIARSL